MRILLVAHQGNYHATMLLTALNRRGAQTHLVTPDALKWSAIRQADALLLDPCLSRDEAIVICREVRSTFDIPIVIISEPTGKGDQIAGIRAGADHYIERPYHIDQLIASIIAATRPRGRTRDQLWGQSRKSRIGDLKVDAERMRVTVNGADTDLTKKEFQLLAVMMGEDGAVCSREKLATEVWGRPEEEVYDSIQVLMSRLRAKLGHERIKTVRSVGYRIVAPPSTLGNNAVANRK